MDFLKSDIHNRELVYTPDSNVGFGLKVWAEMARELVNGGELMWRLFVRDISAKYRQSVFGYVWALVPAIVATFVFTYLKGSGVLPIGDTGEIPYAPYVLVGITIWQLFATGLIRCTQSLAMARSIIVHINFSREALVIAAFGESIFNFMIRLVLVTAVFAWFKIIPFWTAIFIPFILIPLVVITLGIGFLLALANGVFRDIANSLTLLLTFGMFLAPVVSPLTKRPWSIFNYINPASPYIIATRDLIFTGTLSNPASLLWMSVVSIFVFLAGWRLFHLSMTRIVERV